MLVHSLAPKYERFVVLGSLRYWTPPSDHLTPPLLKSDDLFFREPRNIGPPPFKNPGHAPGTCRQEQPFENVVAYNWNLFLKMGHSTKWYHCGLWDFKLVEGQ